MRDDIKRAYPAYASFNLRRAAEERAKAEAADSEHERQCRLEMAAIFEVRAKTLPILH